MPLSLYTPLFQLGRYVSSDAVEMPAFYQITSRKNKAVPVSWTVSASFPGELLEFIHMKVYERRYRHEGGKNA